MMRSKLALLREALLKKAQSATPQARLQLVADLLGGEDILDEDGNPTGEKTPQIITIEQARALLLGDD